MDTTEKYLPTDLPEEIPASVSTPPSQNQHSYSEVKTLLAWSGPGRPFKKRGKQFSSTAILITFLIEVVLFLFSQSLLMLVVGSLLFLSFSFAFVPPRKFHYRISSEGITVEDHFYLWQELYDFYFKRREGVDVLHVRTHSFLPGELSIPLGDMDKSHVRSVILSYLPFRELIKPTFMEKSADWLSKSFPLDKQP